MKKTPVAGKFIRKINEANDNVCFASLQQLEFKHHLDSLIKHKKADQNITTDLFPSNKFAKSINLKVEELPEYSNKTEIFALQMGVMAATEFVLSYMVEIQALREGLFPIEDGAPSNDKEEEQLRLKLLHWNCSILKAEYLRTLGYFRLLRNHYAHVNENPNSAFKTYIRSYGTPLNVFWNNAFTDLQGIDFLTLPSVKLTPNLTFGIMNALRVSLIHVDEMVAETVSRVAATEWTVRQILATPSGKKLTVERLSSKAATRLGIDWNINGDLATTIGHVTAYVSKA